MFSTIAFKVIIGVYVNLRKEKDLKSRFFYCVLMSKYTLLFTVLFWLSSSELGISSDILDRDS